MSSGQQVAVGRSCYQLLQAARMYRMSQSVIRENGLWIYATQLDLRIRYVYFISNIFVIDAFFYRSFKTIFKFLFFKNHCVFVNSFHFPICCRRRKLNLEKFYLAIWRPSKFSNRRGWLPSFFWWIWPRTVHSRRLMNLFCIWRTVEMSTFTSATSFCRS